MSKDRFALQFLRDVRISRLQHRVPAAMRQRNEGGSRQERDAPEQKRDRGVAVGVFIGLVTWAGVIDRPNRKSRESLSPADSAKVRASASLSGASRSPVTMKFFIE